MSQELDTLANNLLCAERHLAEVRRSLDKVKENEKANCSVMPQLVPSSKEDGLFVYPDGSSIQGNSEGSSWLVVWSNGKVFDEVFPTAESAATYLAFAGQGPPSMWRTNLQAASFTGDFSFPGVRIWRTTPHHNSTWRASRYGDIVMKDGVPAWFYSPELALAAIFNKGDKSVA